ncbi:MAG TPA: hypothetical protein VFW40_13020 [Capsulimonadaceae bacterium]|nr:hypothetical protein [Capsulimonadaceae bacterium]
MHTLIHNWADALYSVACLAGAILLGMVALGSIRKYQVEMSRQTVGMLEQHITALNLQINELRTALNLQEKRLYRIEVSDQRKKRLLRAARKEIDLLNEIVRVSMGALTRLNAGEKEQVGSLLTELAAFRLKSSAEQDEWDEQQELALIFLDRQTDRQIAPNIATNFESKGES